MTAIGSRAVSDGRGGSSSAGRITPLLFHAPFRVPLSCGRQIVFAGEITEPNGTRVST
jgi:hypothetical protein